MSNFLFSVVIPTYNRVHLVGRAVQSALDQNWPELEVVVVDDASTDGTAELMKRSFPSVYYVRQDSNRGQCAARNRGLREASRPWVVFLDDDDTVEAGGLGRIARRIAQLTNAEHFPVFQFTHSTGRIPAAFLLARLEHYLGGVLHGDFMPVVCKERFLAAGLAYPEARRAGERLRSGEALLWWQVAEKFGIPTWADRVAKVHTDAPGRNGSARYQLHFARDFAEFHDRTLSEFGEIMATKFPAYYRKERLAAATFWILARRRAIARSRLHSVLQQGFSPTALGLWVLSFLPTVFARTCFSAYRRHWNGRVS